MTQEPIIKKVYSVRLRPDVIEILRTLAEQDGVTVTDLIEDAIEAKISSEGRVALAG